MYTYKEHHTPLFRVEGRTIPDTRTIPDITGVVYVSTTTILRHHVDFLVVPKYVLVFSFFARSCQLSLRSDKKASGASINI